MERHCKWRGGTTLTQQGYVDVYKPEHPRANKTGYIRRSWLVIEETTGHVVQPGEDVHHINEVVTDDRPENLSVLSHGEHRKLHNAKRREAGEALKIRQSGESNRWAKLTLVDVRTIRASRGVTQRELARKFGVSEGNIQKIVSGKLWREDLREQQGRATQDVTGGDGCPDTCCADAPLDKSCTKKL
jgi:DNA-binding transcriptional regulator YiaG